MSLLGMITRKPSAVGVTGIDRKGLKETNRVPGTLKASRSARPKLELTMIPHRSL